MRPTVLLILDGWGEAPAGPGNAIEAARKPFFDKLRTKYPQTLLRAHGKFVGLPSRQVGNSEAGHMNLGAGRLVEQDSVLISGAIKDGRFAKNLALTQTLDQALTRKSAVHLLGLISDGESPHSSLDHLYALADMADARGVEKIYVHFITDGRDSPQFSALRIMDSIKKRLNGRVRIASLMGRFYAMDRGKNWSRIKKAYDCLTGGSKLRFKNYRDALLHAYNCGVSDEYLEPTVIGDDDREIKKSRISDGDAVIFFNLRSDRARQLTKCFVQKDFNRRNPQSFFRKKVLTDLKFCALTDFGPDLDHVLTAFPGSQISDTLPVVLREIPQAYIAETEKYAHVTYFMNGGFADPVNGEKRVRVPSLKIRNYAQKPAMSIAKITAETLKALREGREFITVNFANPDMVGHTGVFPAVVAAIEEVDRHLKILATAILKAHGTLLVTADHGNAETMLDPATGEIWSGHTANPVPFILVDDEYRGAKLKRGSLSQVAPTIYRLFGLSRLPTVIGESLLK